MASLREILLYGDSLDLTSHVIYRYGRVAMPPPLKSNAIIVSQPLKITYEVSHNEPLHPDPQVCARMMEVGLSTCEHGCKIYKDPWSSVTVLAHNSSYGCMK